MTNTLMLEGLAWRGHRQGYDGSTPHPKTPHRTPLASREPLVGHGMGPKDKDGEPREIHRYADEKSNDESIRYCSRWS
jgi:hypothetical protein